MRRIGYAAANLGERELIFGFEVVGPVLEEQTLPFISANFVYQDSAQPVVEPFIVKTVKSHGADGKERKVRIGILGLNRMSSGLSQRTEDGRRIVTLDPKEAARRVLPELRSRSDLVVALVVMEQDEAKALAQEVKGIDLILGGFGARLTPTRDLPDQTLVGETRILYAGNQGKKIGEVRVFLDPEGNGSRLERMLVSLGTRVPDDPDLSDLMERNRFAINEINRNEAPRVDTAKVRESFRGISYVRSEACKECHEAEYKSWENSRHSHAFQILADKHQDYNPECVGCHTTGFRRPTGFINLKSTPDLVNVQCEACHGPGGNHPEGIAAGYGPVGRQFCVRCHTPSNSPSFDADAYLFKIRHWEERTPTAGASASPR